MLKARMSSIWYWVGWLFREERWILMTGGLAVVAMLGTLIPVLAIPSSDGDRPCGRPQGDWQYVGYVQREKVWEVYSDSQPTSEDGRLVTFKAACWQREVHSNINRYDSDLVGDFVVDQARDSLLIFGPGRRELYGR